MYIYAVFVISRQIGWCAFLRRVDATLMVIEIDNSLKDTAKAIVEEFGY